MFSTEATLFYITTNKVQRFQFLHIIAITCYFLFKKKQSHSHGCELVPTLLWFNLHLPND